MIGCNDNKRVKADRHTQILDSLKIDNDYSGIGAEFL